MLCMLVAYKSSRQTTSAFATHPIAASIHAKAPGPNSPPKWWPKVKKRRSERHPQKRPKAHKLKKKTSDISKEYN